MISLIDLTLINAKLAEMLESGLSIRGGTRYFYPSKWSLVPPDFKECCIRYS